MNLSIASLCSLMLSFLAMSASMCSWTRATAWAWFQVASRTRLSRPERSWGWHWPHSEVLATPPSRIGGLRRHIEHLLELSEQHVSIVCHHYRLLMIKIVIMLIEPLTERWLKMMLVYTSNLGGRRCCRVDSWFDHRLELFNIVWVERWSASGTFSIILCFYFDSWNIMQESVGCLLPFNFQNIDPLLRI